MSTFTGPTVADAELPALSTHVPVIDWPAPSPRIVGPERTAMPDRASEQLKLTVIEALFQPFGFGATDGEPVMVGSVRSTFMSLTVAEAGFPASSVHVAFLDWLAPSVDTV